MTGFWPPVGVTSEKTSRDEGLQCETYHGATERPKPPECGHSDQQQQYQQRYGQERPVGLMDRAETQIQGRFMVQRKQTLNNLPHATLNPFWMGFHLKVCGVRERILIGSYARSFFTTVSASPVCVTMPDPD